MKIQKELRARKEVNMWENINKYSLYKQKIMGASLVVQWLRIRLPMQGTWVRALAQEDPTCRRATKPICHNY